jgi:hypothetical protein
MNRKIVNFLKPTRLGIALFLILMIINFIASAQGWVFSWEKDMGLPEPWGYKITKNIPGVDVIWVLGMFILIPVLYITQPVLGPIRMTDFVIEHRTVADFIDKYLFYIISPIYLYLLSCLVVLVIPKIKAQK